MSEPPPESAENQNVEGQKAKQPPIETRSTADYLIDNKVGTLGDIDPAHTVVFISKEEERSRLREAEADGQFRRWKDLITHIAVLALLAAVIASSVLIARSETASKPDKEWARAMVSAIVGAGAGYAFGKESSNA